jgi:hypothetical protein
VFKQEDFMIRIEADSAKELYELAVYFADLLTPGAVDSSLEKEQAEHL